MNKYFYSHIIETESLTIAINDLAVSDSEKAHLIALVDSSLHHTVLDAILSELSEIDKKTFLRHMVEDDHDKIWKHLNEKVDGIEEKIKKAAHNLREQLHEDIKVTKEA